jgi:hypothetical protein
LLERELVVGIILYIYGDLPHDVSDHVQNRKHSEHNNVVTAFLEEAEFRFLKDLLRVPAYATGRPLGGARKLLGGGNR